MAKTEKTEDTGAFLRELADLSHKYGIAISDEHILFVMDRDDHSLGYEMQADGRIRII